MGAQYQCGGKVQVFALKAQGFGGFVWIFSAFALLGRFQGGPGYFSHAAGRLERSTGKPFRFASRVCMVARFDGW
jgi:hypothetical protein